MRVHSIPVEIPDWIRFSTLESRENWVNIGGLSELTWESSKFHNPFTLLQLDLWGPEYRTHLYRQEKHIANSPLFNGFSGGTFISFIVLPVLFAIFFCYLKQGRHPRHPGYVLFSNFLWKFEFQSVGKTVSIAFSLKFRFQLLSQSFLFFRIKIWILASGHIATANIWILSVATCWV